MRANRQLAVLAAMLLVVGEYAFGAEETVSLVRQLFARLTWEELLLTSEDPVDICSRVRHNVEYREDIEEEWPKGREVWERGYGDCEDMANCIVDACREQGIEAMVLVFHPEGSLSAHAVAIGMWRGRLWIASNGWHESVKSMDHAKTIVAKQMGWRKKKLLVASLENIVPPDANPAIASNFKR